MVGSDDEAFYADKYEEVMSAVTNKGTYEIVDGIDHLAIVEGDEAIAAIRAVFK